MASNLTSGNFQSYDPGHGTRLMQGVKPDIVLIQEFDYGDNSATTLQNYVTSTFGASFTYFRESEGSDNIPNGVISRWPIIAAGEWADTYVPDRDYVWARIDIPGPKDLWVVSLHLLERRRFRRPQQRGETAGEPDPGEHPRRGLPGHRWRPQHRQPRRVLRLHASPRWCRPPARTRWTRTTGRAPTPAGPSRTTGSSSMAICARTREPPSSAAAPTPTGLVLDSRVYTPLSEIAPAQSGDSGATNMQHMGVIKDFLVPAN